jgi:hypothetical protein
MLQRHTKVGGLANVLSPISDVELCSVPDLRAMLCARLTVFGMRLNCEVHKRVVSVQTREVLSARG